ncbi:TetR/AcrR family transcriptional regulator [Jiangella alkaliphila]|uniref:DNA-binding transcriptional regulator YbjK n=1 Tax=Jiangella alkaliphila TaxID=419479 RepID=A0A1H2GWI8_9ACTN|nr:TetR/AcrR family transcriptional regulator [Jiangella alkaliphila]SDU23954.1 DNA-binding transcriptional regulator YbjK [Jiangella alkaliphila]
MATSGGTPRTTPRSTARGQAREDAILQAAGVVLERDGAAALSTRRVAEQARASKETIYARFGSRRGLLEALVLQQSTATNDLLRAALDAPADRPVRPVLEDAVAGLLTLLTGARSLALNRAAIAGVPADTDLAEVLYQRGRATTGPLFEALLARATASGELDCPDPAEAFGVLFGLAVRDAQITALLGGGPAWTRPMAEARATQAVALFYRLYAGR